MDENNEKTVRSEISELKEAVKGQGQKIDKIQERIGRISKMQGSECQNTLMTLKRRKRKRCRK